MLGLGSGGRKLVSNFPCTGMHGGKIYLRGDCSEVLLPDQLTVNHAAEQDMEEISEYIFEFSTEFGFDPAQVLDAPFTVVTPDTKNPYKQMYVAN